MNKLGNKMKKLTKMNRNKKTIISLTTRFNVWNEVQNQDYQPFQGLLKRKDE